jgi:hypothetical protein
MTIHDLYLTMHCHLFHSPLSLGVRLQHTRCVDGEGELAAALRRKRRREREARPLSRVRVSHTLQRRVAQGVMRSYFVLIGVGAGVWFGLLYIVLRCRSQIALLFGLRYSAFGSLVCFLSCIHITAVF